LTVYNNKFKLGSACVGSEPHSDTTKSLKICYLLTLVISKISEVDELKQRINTNWASLNRAATERAAGEWRQRLRACVRAGGRHYEHKHA